MVSDLTSNPEKILRPSPVIKLSGNKENLENIRTEILTEEGDYSTLKNQNPSTQAGVYTLKNCPIPFFMEWSPKKSLLYISYKSLSISMKMKIKTLLQGLGRGVMFEEGWVSTIFEG